MKFYKLRHKPTGLFYTPSKWMSGTFSLKGKIYQNKPKPEQMVTMRFPWSFINDENPKGQIAKILQEWVPEIHGKGRECYPVNYNDWEVVSYDIELPE